MAHFSNLPLLSSFLFLVFISFIVFVNMYYKSNKAYK